MRVPGPVSGLSSLQLRRLESEGIQDIDFRAPSMWVFTSDTERNALGYPTGYEIMPEATAVDFLDPTDPSFAVGAFATHQLWVTPYDPDQNYAAGVYVTNSKGMEGLPAWTKANRNIKDTDIVAWYWLASIMLSATRTRPSCQPCGTNFNFVR